MGSDWIETTLGEFAPFNYGKGLAKKARNPDGVVPVYGSNGVIGFHDTPLIDDAGIIIGRKGSIGKVNYCPKPFWPIDTTFYVKKTSDKDIRFVYYLLCSLPMNEMNSDSAVPGLNRTAAHNLIIRVPPLAEQKRIAHILGTLDDKIELNQRMNETLEAMARAIFKAWFVDFEPVKAKLKGEAYPLPDEVMALFPDELVESELGLIPQGWRVGVFGDLCEKPQYGYTASASEKKIGPKFLRIKDINKKPWIEWASVPYCEISEKDRGKYLLNQDDVLIARMADPGHAVLIEEKVNAVFASYLIRFRPLDIRYYRYIQFWQKSSLYWNLINSRKVGTTRPSINAKVLSSFPILLPSKDLSQAFSKIVKPTRKTTTINVRVSVTLAEIRDAMLPKLIGGELKVENMHNKFL